MHIYRLVCENTIEENILKKSDQKRQLDFLAIQSGGFNTEILAKMNLSDFFSGAGGSGSGGAAGMSKEDVQVSEAGLSQNLFQTSLWCHPPSLMHKTS